MKVLRVFFVGLIYGRLLRWVIDKIFMEDKLRILDDENALLRQRVMTLEAVPRVEEVSNFSVAVYAPERGQTRWEGYISRPPPGQALAAPAGCCYTAAGSYARP